MTTLSQAPAQPLNLATNFDFANFDPDQIDIEEVVNITLLIDTSGSMQDHKDHLNQKIKEMIEDIKSWHQAPKIFFSIGTFDSKIEVLTGFQPVKDVKIPVFNPLGDSTRLYDACLEFLKNVINQHQGNRKAGVTTKSIFFVLTDGRDNASAGRASTEVKKLIDFMREDESTAGTFGSIMCGIGDKQPFEEAQQFMGIQKLFVTGNGDLREVIGFLSQSISSASSTPGGTLVNF